jgi:hypothetical protein
VGWARWAAPLRDFHDTSERSERVHDGRRAWRGQDGAANCARKISSERRRAARTQTSLGGDGSTGWMPTCYHPTTSSFHTPCGPRLQKVPRCTDRSQTRPLGSCLAVSDAPAWAPWRPSGSFCSFPQPSPSPYSCRSSRASRLATTGAQHAHHHHHLHESRRQWIARRQRHY